MYLWHMFNVTSLMIDNDVAACFKIVNVVRFNVDVSDFLWCKHLVFFLKLLETNCAICSQKSTAANCINILTGR